MAKKLKEALEAPPTAPHATGARVARVHLLVGMSCTSRGMRFTARHPQTVVGDELIEAFKNDGNFSVEELPEVAGGSPARQE